jgi:hypothetical protein
MNTYRLYCDDGYCWLVQASTSGMAAAKAERSLGRRICSWEVSTGRKQTDRELPAPAMNIMPGFSMFGQ